MGVIDSLGNAIIGWRTVREGINSVKLLVQSVVGIGWRTVGEGINSAKLLVQSVVG